MAVELVIDRRYLVQNHLPFGKLTIRRGFW